MVKLYAIAVLNKQGASANHLAIAKDVSSFGFFQRGTCVPPPAPAPPSPSPLVPSLATNHDLGRARGGRALLCTRAIKPRARSGALS